MLQRDSLNKSIACHPQPNGQTKIVKCSETYLSCICIEKPSWSKWLPHTSWRWFLNRVRGSNCLYYE